MPPRRLIETALVRLTQYFGPRPWKCWGKGVSVLVDTILSQNTHHKNSDAAYKQLRRRYKSWNAVANAPVDELERTIRVAGLSRQKAPRIQSILCRIKQDHGTIDLQSLATVPEQQAFDYLLSFPGIGPKTANCILLFSFNHPVFPVDTHIHRIAIRLGLIPVRTTADQAHTLLKPLIPATDRYALHVLLIELGRKICKATTPLCPECPLLPICPTGKSHQQKAHG